MQTRYARAYLDAIPGREQIRHRVREFLDVETCDSLQKVGARYFFRKRLAGTEQPCIFCRDRTDEKDQVLIDPAQRGTGKYTAVRPLQVSRDGRLLLSEVKQGGERAGTLELLDITTRRVLPDAFPRGYLRGFGFGRDSQTFYYVHEPAEGDPSRSRSVYLHSLGTNFKTEDREVFRVNASENVRLHIILGQDHVGILILRYPEFPCISQAVETS